MIRKCFLLQESIEKYGILNPLRLAIWSTAEGRSFYERLPYMEKAHINSKKRLPAKRRQAQRNYKIYLHDFYVHTHAQNTPMEDMSFF